MRSYGYGTYRGRSGFRTFLKVVIVILLLILLVIVVGFFALEKYFVFDSEGMHVALPFLQAQESESPDPPEISMPVVVPPSPTPTPTPDILHAVSLPRSALYDGTAQAQVTAAGGEAALFDMKADDGTLGYLSSLELAVKAKASPGDQALNAAIQGLTGSGLYTVARVSCFRDNLIPYRNGPMGLKSPNGNWRDQGSLRWLNPSVPEARQYVADVCRELAELGFQEILLDNCGYPVEGKLANIRRREGNYVPGQLEPVIMAFYDEVRAALADYPDVKLSIMTTQAVLVSGSDPDAGQSLDPLLERADRLWLRIPAEDTTDYGAQMEGHGASAEEDLVLVGAEAGASGSSWAIWISE